MIIIFFLLFIILIIFNMYLIKDNFMNKLRQSPYINPIPTNQRALRLFDSDKIERECDREDQDISESN